MKNLRESSVNPLWILLNIYCIQKNPKRIQNESNGNPNEYIMYLNESVKESIMDFPESNLDFPGKLNLCKDLICLENPSWIQENP